MACLGITLSSLVAQEATEPIRVEIGTVQAQMKYDTAEFTVPPAVPVKLVLKNSDDLPHNLVVCDREGVSLAVAQVAWELGEKGFEKQWIPDDKRVLAATSMVDPQQSGDVTFTSPEKEGRYDFVCTYPGHAVIMKGVMIVSKSNAASDDIKPPRGPIKDLTYTLYKGSWNNMPDFASLTPEETDSIPGGRISLSASGGLSNQFALVFEGLITAPEAGEFTFSVASDDGSQIFINDQLIVDNDGIHGRKEMKGNIRLEAGEHRLRCTYFERDGEENLEVNWNGPGLKGRARRLSTRPPRRQNNRIVTGIPLVPQERTIIYRNFIAGAGNRAIGVGFPGGVNLAFDADQVRLALMWTDEFMDAARHWEGRGQGAQPPSGKNVIALPAGEGFALLEAPTSSWPEPTPRSQNSRFKGYRLLETVGNPEFLYTVTNGIEITDRYTGVTSETGKRSLLRKITVTGKPAEGKQLCLRIASGGIAKEKEATFLTSSGQRITVEGASTVLHDDSLIIPIALEDGSSAIDIAYQWLTAKADTKTEEVSK